MTWTATDGSGPTAQIDSANQHVSVIDNQNQYLFTEIRLSQNENDGCTCPLGDASASGNCVGVTVTNDGPTIFPIGTTSVTWAATDGAGHHETLTQKVTVTTPGAPTPMPASTRQ